METNETITQNTINTESFMKWEKAPDILTVKEAAQLLRVGKNRMYELCKIENFPRIILGCDRGIRIPKEALKNWIEDQVNMAKTA